MAVHSSLPCPSTFQICTADCAVAMILCPNDDMTCTTANVEVPNLLKNLCTCMFVASQPENHSNCLPHIPAAGFNLSPSSGDLALAILGIARGSMANLPSAKVCPNERSISKQQQLHPPRVTIPTWQCPQLWCQMIHRGDERPSIGDTNP